MRSYLHRPDEPFLQDQVPTLVRRIGLSEEAIPKKVAEGKVRIYDAAVDTAFTLTRVQWALGEPLDEVLATMRRTSKRVRDALGHGFVLEPHTADRWLEISIIGGDPATAATIGAAVERGLDGLDTRGEVVSSFMAGLLALLRGQRAAAGKAAEALSRGLDDPSTSPATATSCAGLDALVAATARGDQDAFDRAAEARRQVIAVIYGGSIELRRSANGLLDAAGTAVARLAAKDGLLLLEGDPYLGTELLAALPWPGSGS
ncbi:MAG TPA: hypothetical protein VM942_10910 [Acidimicrobiales bacterium]|nr:hypothetical protein [Acidimicrobiales bacterium]